MSTPGQTTLGTIRTLVRQRTNTENSQVVTDSELNSLICLYYQELYGLLVEQYQEKYYVTSYQFQTDGVSTLYPLPSDFFKGFGLDLSLTGLPNTWITVRTFNFRERNKLNNVWLPASVSAFLQNVRYSFQGSNIMITPLAAVGQHLQLWYAPRLTLPVLDTDIIDGVNGWENYIIVSTCAAVVTKQEDDPTPYLNEKANLTQRIIEDASQRNAGDTTAVADVYEDNGWGY